MTPRRSADERCLDHEFSAGSEGALRAAYDAHGSVIYTFCRRTLDDTRAADVTQDVFVSAWKAHHRFDPDKGSLIAWLIAIAKNRIIDNVRAESRHLDRRADDDAQLSVEDAVESVSDKMIVAAALARLPERTRSVIELHYFDDLTHQQIADRTTLPLGTVKSDIRRGLSTVRQLLETANG